MKSMKTVTAEDVLLWAIVLAVVVFISLCAFGLVSLAIQQKDASFHLATIDKDHITVQSLRQGSLKICIQKADILNDESHLFRWVCAAVPGPS